jgi:hypothetical protein
MRASPHARPSSRPLISVGVATVLAVLLAACGPPAAGNGGGNGNGNGNGNGTGNGTGNGSGGNGESPSEVLIEGAFSIPPYSELYQCIRVTTDEDLWITQITPIAPLGTHHTLLAIDGGTSPDGSTTCGPFAPAWTTLFASGLGSPPLNMPEGVALRIPAGEQMLLNLHLFNPSGETIEGVAGLEARFADPDDIEHEAGVVLAGPADFVVPQGPEVLITGACTLQSDTNFFALFPHMHQYGRWMRVWAEEELVYDGGFDFEHQDFYEFDAIPMAQGDRIHVECTYENLTDSTIQFGDSSDQEMCYAISYLYPWTGYGFTSLCTF